MHTPALQPREQPPEDPASPQTCNGLGRQVFKETTTTELHVEVPLVLQHKVRSSHPNHQSNPAQFCLRPPNRLDRPTPAQGHSRQIRTRCVVVPKATNANIDATEVPTTTSA